MKQKYREIEELQKYSRYYNEPKFWNKVKKLVQKASSQLIYYALLLYYAMLDNRVPLKNKAIIVAALGYLIFPFDALPDFIPALGLTDDLTAIMMAYQNIKSSLTPEAEEKAIAKTKELTGKNAPVF